MRAIEVSDEVYQKLQAIAVPFQDSPSTVIERLLASAIGGARRSYDTTATAAVSNSSIPSTVATDDGNYTYKRPITYTFDGHSYPASTFKEIYLGLCREMATRHADSFDRVLALRGRERTYFSGSGAEMTHPQRVEGTNIFAETNFSAQNIMDRCRELVKLFGYGPESLVVDTRPVNQL